MFHYLASEILGKWNDVELFRFLNSVFSFHWFGNSCHLYVYNNFGECLPRAMCVCVSVCI